MQTMHERRDPVRLFTRRLLLLGLVILCILIISGVWSIYRKERQAASLNAEAQIQLAELTKRQNDLSSNIANLKTDRGMEAAVREQYDMGKNGENLIIIVNPTIPKPIQATSTPFKRWLHKAFPWW